jgi:hypothetical protein
LKEVSKGICKAFLNVYKFLRNELEGRIKSEYDIGEIINYRQDMVGKVGILHLTFELLTILRGINEEIQNENEWGTRLYEIFTIKDDLGVHFQNTLDLIFETLYWLFYGNVENQHQASFHIKIMQKYVFVENISKVLISLFKDRQFGMNKKEIHGELMYRRIFEFERFEPIAKFFVKKLK